MAGIFAIVPDGPDAFRIASGGTSIPLGDAAQTRMFVNAMQNNTVLQYFKDRSDAMTATHDWEDISDMFDNGPKVEELLQTSTRMVFENTTVYVAPIGENLATAMDGDMASLQSGLAGEAETGTMSEALDKVVAELVAV